MRSIERYNEYKDENLDTIILKIKNGTIKSGKYSNLVKIDKHYKIKGHTLFNENEGGDSDVRNSEGK